MAVFLKIARMAALAFAGSGSDISPIQEIAQDLNFFSAEVQTLKNVANFNGAQHVTTDCDDVHCICICHEIFGNPNLLLEMDAK